MKRQRMDDHLPSYGGPAGMSYGGASMVDGGGYMPERYGAAPAGSAGVPEFPLVKLRGLPFNVSDEEIRVFLGVDPIDIVLLKRDGRLTGEAFVLLSSPMHVDMALSKNRSYMGRRYIEIYKAKKPDYYRAVVSEVTEGGLSSSRHHTPRGDRYMDHPLPQYTPQVPDHYSSRGPPTDGTAGTTIIKLRGLPFSVTDDDVCQWFNQDTSLGLASPVVKDNVLVVMDRGRPTGIAFVEFPYPQEATAALSKNKQMMGSRYIEIFPASRGDLDKLSWVGGTLTGLTIDIIEDIKSVKWDYQHPKALTQQVQSLNLNLPLSNSSCSSRQPADGAGPPLSYVDGTPYTVLVFLGTDRCAPCNHQYLCSKHFPCMLLARGQLLYNVGQACREVS